MDNATRISLAVLFGLVAFVVTLSFTPNAHAFTIDENCKWNDCPFGILAQEGVNRSYTETFDVRKSHSYGWHFSKVCGLELCSGQTATETSAYQGLTVGGAKPNVDVAFNGKYYIKGTFPIGN